MSSPARVPSPNPHDTRLSDAAVQAAVVAELDWVPDVDASHVGVAATDGAVTLAGEVGTYPEKQRAVRAAQRVRGVLGVADELVVRTVGGPVNDTDVARAAGEAIARAVDVPPGAVRVEVRDRLVTLTGAVPRQHHRAAAGRAVAHLHGVRDVHNLITTSPGVVTAAIHAEITEALVRNARLDGLAVEVTADGAGTVTLHGTVRTWGERRQAEQACWAAPGVLTVTDDLVVAQ